MRDHLTYADLAGRRRLRRYVIAAALILGFLGLLFGWAGWQRVQSLDQKIRIGYCGPGERSWQLADSRRVTAHPDTRNCGMPSRPGIVAFIQTFILVTTTKRIEPALRV